MTAPLHATLVCDRAGPGGWRGALLLGPSGAGKSDLALRLLTGGFTLVADDRVILWASGGAAWGRAPDVLSGLIELRGQGMAAVPVRPLARVDLAVRLRPPPERQPEPAWITLAGVQTPVGDLDPFAPSAGARLRRMLHRGVTPL